MSFVICRVCHDILVRDDEKHGGICTACLAHQTAGVRGPDGRVSLMAFEKEQPIEPVLVKLMNDIGRMIGAALKATVKDSGEEYGFALLMFGIEGDESCRMNYISNCDRQDMLAAMREFIARNEGTYEPDFTRKRH